MIQTTRQPIQVKEKQRSAYELC